MKDYTERLLLGILVVLAIFLGTMNLLNKNASQPEFQTERASEYLSSVLLPPETVSATLIITSPYCQFCLESMAHYKEISDAVQKFSDEENMKLYAVVSSQQHVMLQESLFKKHGIAVDSLIVGSFTDFNLPGVPSYILYSRDSGITYQSTGLMEGNDVAQFVSRIRG